MIRPMSPEPGWRPAAGEHPGGSRGALRGPAVNALAGRSPGMRMAAQVRSRAPMARTVAPVSTWAARASPDSSGAVVVLVEEVGVAEDVDPVVEGLLEHPVGVLGAGELLAEVVQAEPGVDALQRDPAGLRLTVDHGTRSAPPRRAARAAPSLGPPPRRRRRRSCSASGRPSITGPPRRRHARGTSRPPPRLVRDV